MIFKAKLVEFGMDMAFPYPLSSVLDLYLYFNHFFFNERRGKGNKSQTRHILSLMKYIKDNYLTVGSIALSS